VKKVGYWWHYNGAPRKVQNLRKKGQNFFGGAWDPGGHDQPVFAKYAKVP
jgi:hypothetical protein